MDNRCVTEPPNHKELTGISRLNLFWALSRTPHGLLDMCTPAFAALLALGAFPPVESVLIGLVTTFAGYTAVYALNDVVDYRVDREKADAGVLPTAGSDLDAVIVRHPMAQGLLSFREGLAWAVFWAGVALIGAFLLNPVCAAIFLGGAALETLYCLLWRVSPYRTLVSGAVKTTGAMAAVFAVDPHPSPVYLIALFAMLFFWEIGGQNIPNDLSDIEEDRRMRARTIPVTFGAGPAIAAAAASLAATVLINPAVFLLSPLPASSPLSLAALGAGWYLLLLPAWRLYRSRGRAQAMALFNRASIYPPALLAVVLVSLIFP